MRRTQGLLLLLALVLAWGEAVAAPFFCLHDQDQIEAVGVVAATPVMPAMTGEMHHHDHAMMMEHHTGNVSDAPLPVASVHVDHTTSCDNSCQFCRGMNLPDLAAPLPAGMPLLLPWASVAPMLSATVPPPAAHFRPPAVA